MEVLPMMAGTLRIHPPGHKSLPERKKKKNWRIEGLNPDILKNRLKFSHPQQFASMSGLKPYIRVISSIPSHRVPLRPVFALPLPRTNFSISTPKLSTPTAKITQPKSNPGTLLRRQNRKLAHP
jgi:hypothetical protein